MERRAPWRFARLFVLLMAAVVVVSLLGMTSFAEGTEPVAEKECYLTGDLNSDGSFDSRDAIYALYSYLFGGEEYPISQNWDINSDEKNNHQDAIKLLYVAMGLGEPEYAHIGEEAHDYYDPVWSWTETGDGVVAAVILRCGCGKETPLTSEQDFVITAGEPTAASCLQAGSVVYSASVTYDGAEYTSSHTVVLPALGHTAGEVQHDDNEHYSLCVTCDEKLNAASHNWIADGDPSAATCKVQAVQKYVCACGAEKSAELGYSEHSYTYVQDVLVDATTCEYGKLYQCATCEGTITTDLYNNHDYVASVVEATCQAAGAKTYTCSACGHVDTTKSVVIEQDATKHLWDEGVEADGIITHSCTVEGCEETKTTVSVSTNGTVSKEALDQANELKLDNNTTVAIDDTVKNGLDITESIQITVGAVAEETLDALLSAEQKEQIGENTVYDFNMMVDGNNVSEFGGEITVSLPYTLADGEDIDSIDVWYIDNEGKLASQEATYSNGYVTFKTSHFSYYTVTRLTPAERCARYGHIWTDSNKAATCTEAGYTKQVCQRCAAEQEYVEIGATGHDYAEDTASCVAATCESYGKDVEKCANCGHTKTTVIPALGHEMELSATVEATCDSAGKKTYVCANDGCQHETEETIAQLTHSYVLSETVAATCTAGGYEIHVCEHCQADVKKNETAPTGHNYGTGNAVWTWAEDNESATLTLSCDHDCGSTKELKANVTVTSASCTGSGSVKATISYNNKTYTDEKVTGNAAGHKPGSNWVTNAAQHYHVCQVCNERLDIATHDFGDGVVTKAPTCSAVGTMTYTCAVCNYSKEESISATGVHDYVNGVCTGCGHVEAVCNHTKLHTEAMDLSAYNICKGTVLAVEVCDCGEYRNVIVESDGCEWVEDEYYSMGVQGDGVEYYVQSMHCANCDLTCQYVEYVVITEDPCLGEVICDERLECNGDVIASWKHVLYAEEHPHTESTVEDLNKYGLCGEELVVYHCPCGEITNTYRDASACAWNYDEESSTDLYERYVCEVCGAVRTVAVSYTFDSNTCWYSETVVCSYFVNGVEVYSYTNEDQGYEHDHKLSDYHMYGTSCEDGYEATFACVNCGDSYTTEIYHHEHVKTTVTDLSNSDFCADSMVQSECLCGEEKYHYLSYSDHWCEWQYGNDADGSFVGICAVCGTKETHGVTYGEKDEECSIRAEYSYTYTDKEGNVLCVGYRVEYHTEHDWETNCVLIGETCEDGVQVNRVCKDCGETRTNTRYYHYTYETSREVLSEGELCGDVVRVTVACACGQANREHITWEDGDCSWQYNGWDEELGCEIIVCAVCGAERREYYSEEAIEGDPCHVTVTYRYVYLKNGNELFSYEEEYIGERHTYESTFTLHGETCEDGYDMTRTCVYCNNSFTNTGFTGHTWWRISEETISEGQFCGTLKMITEGCACGQLRNSYVNWEDGYCSFQEYMYSEELEATIFKCDNCDAEYYGISTDARVEGETCQYQSTTHYFYSRDGVDLFDYEREYTYKRHAYEYIFDLCGESCEDGYYLSERCLNCDYTWTDENVRYGHDHHRTAYYSLEDYGMCGGEIENYACACGEYSNWQYFRYCDGEFTGNRDEVTGISEYYCEACNTYSYIDEMTEYNSETCQNIGTFYAKLVRDNEVLVDLQGTCQWESHSYNMVGYELHDGENCENGVTVYLECMNCDHQQTEEYYHHNSWRTQYVDLSEKGACGGFVEVYSCPCGEDSGINWSTACSMSGESWEETQEDGYVHYFKTETCSECGLTIHEEEYYVPEDGSCAYTCHRTHEYWMGEDLLISANDTYRTSRHNYMEPVYSLMDGSVSCENGIWIQRVCADCGDVEQWEAHYHGMNKGQSIDLSQYGSNCGGSLDHYSCACGENQEYRFSEDLLCDLDQRGTEVWIEGAVHDWQETSEGYVWTESYAWTYTCAVTDPQCGLNIRMADYWLVENCWAVRYQTWQLGYSETTDEDGNTVSSWEYEITIPTGDAHAYHNYEQSAINETLEDGTVVDGSQYACPDCGSTYTWKNYYVDGNHVRYEEVAVNMMDNGENQKRTNLVEYGYEYNGRRFTTLDRSERIYADGTTFWSQNVYSYDPDNGCSYTRSWSNSYGDSETYEYKHNVSYGWNIVENPTCSQPGVEVRTGTCSFCEEIIEEDYFDLDPWKHDWSWNDDLGTYCCNRCGLENSNAADGTIVIEDMTEDHGNGTDYVIGYWNQGEGEFTTYVSVIMQDANGDEIEVVLTGIEFTYLTKDADGINALSVSQETVQAAADAALAEAGYTGSYAIRITFVPADSDGTLDYAITFDSQTA